MIEHKILLIKLDLREETIKIVAVYVPQIELEENIKK